MFAPFSLAILDLDILRSPPTAISNSPPLLASVVGALRSDRRTMPLLFDKSNVRPALIRAVPVPPKINPESVVSRPAGRLKLMCRPEVMVTAGTAFTAAFTPRSGQWKVWSNSRMSFPAKSVTFFDKGLEKLSLSELISPLIAVRLTTAGFGGADIEGCGQLDWQRAI